MAAGGGSDEGMRRDRNKKEWRGQERKGRKGQEREKVKGVLGKFRERESREDVNQVKVIGHKVNNKAKKK